MKVLDSDSFISREALRDELKESITHSLKDYCWYVKRMRTRSTLNLFVYMEMRDVD